MLRVVLFGIAAGCELAAAGGATMAGVFHLEPLGLFFIALGLAAA